MADKREIEVLTLMKSNEEALVLSFTSKATIITSNKTSYADTALANIKRFLDDKNLGGDMRKLLEAKRDKILENKTTFSDGEIAKMNTRKAKAEADIIALTTKIKGQS